MPASKGVALFRDLRLNAKVTVTLALVFLTTMAVFLGVLLPLEQRQHRRLLDQNKRLLSILRDKYERDFIHDIVSENSESTTIDLADMARQEGILWVRLDGDRWFEASADPRTIQHLTGEPPPPTQAAGEPAVLVVDEDGEAHFVGAGGRRLPGRRSASVDVLPAWRVKTPAPESFAEVTWNGTLALHTVSSLKAADEVYGRLSVVYSLSGMQHAASQTRLIFYGVLATSFVLLVLLLNLLLSQIVIHPVHSVMDAMSEASRGDLQVRLPVHSHDEIGTMASSFNQMVEELEIAKREIEGYSRNLERMVAERTRALRESEENLLTVKNHLATIIANVATGVISLDDAGTVTTLNERAAEILGLSATESLERPVDAVLGDDSCRPLLDMVAAARASRTAPQMGQVQVRLPVGRRTLSVVASPLVSEGGRRLGTVVVFDDLTQILGAQRLSAWKEAVERVIHEIKNPLTPIGLTAQTLRSAFDADRARFDQMFPSAMDIILDSVRDLKTLITEFTQFSRLPEVRLQAQDLGGILAEVVAPYAQGDDVSVHLETPAQPITIKADHTQLRRVLLNVLNNAVESMEGRRGQVQVSVCGPDAANDLAIVIRDTGCGVEDAERIFEPYYTTKVKGTGLGLAIARQIIEEHGGTIAAESQVGIGTTVTIRLPASA